MATNKAASLDYQQTNAAKAEIEIQDYSKDWPDLYRREKYYILKHLSHLIKDIQHIGSTAIPGLAAKPTIDICIGVEDLFRTSVMDIISGLERSGYTYLQCLEDTIPERRYLQKTDDRGNHLVHIHVVNINGELWNNYIGFRDYLIKHPAERNCYQQLKLDLKKQFSNNREAYTNAKAEHIKDILHKVKQS